jgi:polyferredoxin
VNVRQRDPTKLRRLRQIVQLFFLAGLSFLLVKALLGRVLGSPMPILIVTGSVAILSLVLGRVWCGWACPMGTLLYWTRFKKAARPGRRLSPRWRAVKYVLLAVVLVAITVVTLLRRARPALDWIGGNALIAGTLLLLILAAGVTLNLVADLFWCRALCPLGGALALLARLAPLRRLVRESCNGCSACARACPMGAIEVRREPASGARRALVPDPAECTVCIDCMKACRLGSNGFRFARPFTGRK